MSWIFCVRDHFANIPPFIFAGCLNMCSPYIDVFDCIVPPPAQLNNPVPKIFPPILYFHSETTLRTCTGMAPCPSKYIALCYISYQSKCFSFCSKCIDFIFSLYVAALSRKYILPTKARFRLVERNDYSEMLLNSSRARQRQRFSVIFADDNALSTVDDKMTGPAQRRLNDSKFWQSYKSSWQGVLTNSYNFALSALANPYNFDNAGFDFKIFRLRLSATFNSLASLFVYPVKCFGSITFSVLTWKIF